MSLIFASWSKIPAVYECLLSGPLRKIGCWCLSLPLSLFMSLSLPLSLSLCLSLSLEKLCTHDTDSSLQGERELVLSRTLVG